MSKDNTTGSEKIDIYVSVIDQAILDLQAVVDNLSSEEGVQLINNVGEEVNENLSGEFEEAITLVTQERVLDYKNAIVNVSNMVYILKKYRKYLKKGPNNDITENFQHIFMEPQNMKKEITDLESSIYTSKGKLESNTTVDTYISDRSLYLESEIQRKENHQPEPLDASHERYLLSVLKYNEGKHLNIRPTISDVITELIDINMEIEKQIKILNKDLKSYDMLLDDYEHINSYRDYLTGIESIDEYYDLVALKKDGDDIALKIFNENLLTQEEVYNLILKLIGDKDVNFEAFCTYMANVIYADDASWQNTMNNGYRISEEYFNNHNVELMKLYEYFRYNHTYQTDMIDWSHYGATMAANIGPTSNLSNVGAFILSNGNVDESSGWVGDYIKDGDEISSVDLNTDYMSLLTLRNMENVGENYTDSDAMNDAYNEVEKVVNSDRPLKTWDDFEYYVVEVSKLYTQEEYDNAIGR